MNYLVLLVAVVISCCSCCSVDTKNAEKNTENDSLIGKTIKVWGGKEFPYPVVEYGRVKIKYSERDLNSLPPVFNPEEGVVIVNPIPISKLDDAKLLSDNAKAKKIAEARYVICVDDKRRCYMWIYDQEIGDYESLKIFFVKDDCVSSSEDCKWRIMIYPPDLENPETPRNYVYLGHLDDGGLKKKFDTLKKIGVIQDIERHR